MSHSISAQPSSAQPFTNHFASAMGRRKFWEKNLQFGSNALTLIGHGFSFFDSTAAAAPIIDGVGKEMRYLRNVLRLGDIVDNFVVPDKETTKDTLPLTCTIIEAGLNGFSNIADQATFGNDVGFWDLGGAGKAVEMVGDGLSGGANVANLVHKSYKHVVEADVIKKAKERLEDIEREETELLLNPDYEGKLAAANMVSSASLANEKAELLRIIAKAEVTQSKSDLDIAASVFEIAAVIFGFFAAVISLTLAVASCVLAVFGLAAAIVGIWKVWIDTTEEPVIEQGAPYDLLGVPAIIDPSELRGEHNFDSNVPPLPPPLPRRVTDSIFEGSRNITDASGLVTDSVLLERSAPSSGLVVESVASECNDSSLNEH